MSATTPRPSEKLDAFEGVRGLASVGVFISHLIIGFWPVLYSKGNPYLATFPKPVRWLSESPLRVIYDGQFAVMLFFVLSGFVLSIAFFRRQSGEGIPAAAARRYTRLMIPAAISVLLGYLVLAAGGMHNLAAGKMMNETVGYPHQWIALFYHQDPVARVALRHALWDTFFRGGSVYNQNLWTMSVELPGSFAVYAFALLFGGLRWRIVFYLAAGFVLLCNNFFIFNFLVGVAIADLYAINERSRRPLRLPLVAALALMAAAFYVVFKKPELNNYDLWGIAALRKSYCFESAGSALLIMTVAFSTSLQKLLERRWIAFLGSISFALYLVHLILICSVASYAYLKLRGFGASHDWAGILACVACFATAIPAAAALHWCVDKPAIRLGKWLYECWFQPQREGMASRDRQRPEIVLPWFSSAYAKAKRRIIKMPGVESSSEMRSGRGS